MKRLTRRVFLRAGLAAGIAGSTRASSVWAQESAATRPGQESGVEVLNPQGRVPMSFLIDDSTCLVNMGRFCMPQFAAAWPDRAEYRKPWQTWPREIPDAFVRQFAEFCAEHGVKGKYSVVPYPACVGRLDRELPGWSPQALRDSLKLVREMIVPNFDIHPEMITHTRIIDLRTGQPVATDTPGMQENNYPPTRISVDELTAYLAFALKILKSCGLVCEGVTSPGGFGNRVKVELGLAARQAVGEVFSAEIPHYFKYIDERGDATQPKLEHLEGADGASPKLVVSVQGGTGDWFGGWDGDDPPQGDLYAKADATAGRMVDLIQRGGPAVMVCHWPGLYSHGTKKGFEAFRQVVVALEDRFRERILWMKPSEMARYWAARQLTRMTRRDGEVVLAAPFACSSFTVRMANVTATGDIKVTAGDRSVALRQVTRAAGLKPGTWLQEPRGVVVCFDLPRGESRLRV